MKAALQVLAIVSAIAFVFAILIATAPAYAGPSSAKCHRHAAHTHCH